MEPKWRRRNSKAIEQKLRCRKKRLAVNEKELHERRTTIPTIADNRSSHVLQTQLFPSQTKTRTTNDAPFTTKTMSFDPKTRSPTLKKLLKTRLAPIRENELITKALNPERPIKPPADGRECCGSACKPCVMDLYGEELRVWKECWRDQIPENEDGGNKIDVKPGKMPGSFEW